MAVPKARGWETDRYATLSDRHKMIVDAAVGALKRGAMGQKKSAYQVVKTMCGERDSWKVQARLLSITLDRAHPKPPDIV